MKALVSLKWLVPLLMLSLLVSCKAKKKVSRGQPKAPTTTIQSVMANKLDVQPSQIQNIPLYKFVANWEGIPYKYGGMSRSGVDCSGFSNLLYKDVYAIQLKRTSRDIYKDSKPVKKDHLQEGDLVFFNISGKKASHMGVYLQNGRFVHASSSKGVVISALSNPYYSKYFDRGGRIK